MANLVVHFEIHASEPERLIDFYSGLLGWRFTQFGDAPYWSIETGEGAIGNVAAWRHHEVRSGRSGTSHLRGNGRQQTVGRWDGIRRPAQSGRALEGAVEGAEWPERFVLAEPLDELPGGHGSGDEVPLRPVGAHLLQRTQLALLFDAFDDDAEPEVVPEVDDRTHDREVLMVGEHVADEGLVDLDLVDRKLLQL